jgi:hypothetical protein
VDEHRNVEAWADAVIEQHRTAPAATDFDDEPVIEHLLERSEHCGRLQRRFANLEAVAALVGAVLLAVGAYAFYSGF